MITSRRLTLGFSLATVSAVIWVLVAIVAPAGAQPASEPRLFLGAFATPSTSTLFRFEDQGFGTHPNVGIAAGIRYGRLAVEVEGHRVRLSPRSMTCELLVIDPRPCVGSGRNGVLSASVVSANALYFLSSRDGGRTEAYVIGGLGSMRSSDVGSLIQITATEVRMSEVRSESTGLAINFGVGAAVVLPKGFAIRPELRYYSATAMSRSNLSLFRFSIGIGGWW